MLQIPLSSLVLSVGNIIFYLSVFRVIFNPIYFIAISSFDYWQYFYPAATVQLNLLYSHIYNHFSLAMIEACWTCVVTYPFYFIFLGNELSLNGNKISGVVPLKFAWIPWVNLCIKLLEWISDLSALFCCSSVLLQCHDLHSLSFLFVFFFSFNFNFSQKLWPLPRVMFSYEIWPPSFSTDICSWCASIQPPYSYECWVWWKDNHMGCKFLARFFLFLSQSSRLNICFSLSRFGKGSLYRYMKLGISS